MRKVNTRRDLQLGAVLLIALGLVAGGIRALDLIGGETLRVLALVLAVPAGVAIMAAGFTPLVRAWRVPVTPPPERHIIRETKVHTHTIDGRRVPEPAPTTNPANLYPALQSPAWRAGLLTDGRERGTAGYWRTEPSDRDVDADVWDQWEQ
jgi:hypothetical protein